LPPGVADALRAKLVEWLVRAYADFAKNQAQQFTKASEDPADGVTLRFVIEHPQGLNELCQALLGTAPASAQLGGILANASPAVVRVEVLPGHRCV
jgi:hypothetical protein